MTYERSPEHDFIDALRVCIGLGPLYRFGRSKKPRTFALEVELGATGSPMSLLAREMRQSEKERAEFVYVSRPEPARNSLGRAVGAVFVSTKIGRRSTMENR